MEPLVVLSPYHVLTNKSDGFCNEATQEHCVSLFVRSLILKCFWLKLQRSFDGIYLCFLRNFIGNTKKDSDVFYGKQ